jgi:hypothetical protein
LKLCIFRFGIFVGSARPSLTLAQRAQEAIDTYIRYSKAMSPTATWVGPFGEETSFFLQQPRNFFIRTSIKLRPDWEDGLKSVE